MISRPYALISGVLLLWGTPAHAQAIDFSAFVTFGDSISDNDFLAVGPDPHEMVFDNNASASDALFNYAHKGDTTAELPAQLVPYLMDVVDARTPYATLIGLEIGANDLSNMIGPTASNPPGTNPTVDGAVDTIIANTAAATEWLSYRHPDAVIVLWTLIDMTYAPYYSSLLSETQLDNFRAHIERINTAIWLEDARHNVVVVDMFPIFPELFAAPPTLRGTVVGAEDLFANSSHPSALGNGFVANTAMARLNDELGESLILLSEDDLADLAGFP